jgi:hypothetical protein
MKNCRSKKMLSLYRKQSRYRAIMNEWRSVAKYETDIKEYEAEINESKN